MLKENLARVGIDVQQAEEDADPLIADTTLESAQNDPTVLAGNDTDLLAMLIARVPETSKGVEMLHPASSNTAGKLFDIKKIQEEIGDMKGCVLFAHAISGGDKTCAIYKIGKLKPYRLLEKDAALRQEVTIFNDPNADLKQLEAVAEKFIMRLYPDGSKF